MEHRGSLTCTRQRVLLPALRRALRPCPSQAWHHGCTRTDHRPLALEQPRSSAGHFRGAWGQGGAAADQLSSFCRHCCHGSRPKPTHRHGDCGRNGGVGRHAIVRMEHPRFQTFQVRSIANGLPAAHRYLQSIIITSKRQLRRWRKCHTFEGRCHQSDRFQPFLMGKRWFGRPVRSSYEYGTVQCYSSAHVVHSTYRMSHSLLRDINIFRNVYGRDLNIVLFYIRKYATYNKQQNNG